MRRAACHRQRTSRGSQTVESALTMLVFFTVFIAIADFGQILFIHNSLVERVRMASRTAAILNCNEEQTKNLVLYASINTPSPGVQDRGFMGMTASNVGVTKADLGTTAQRLVVTVANMPYKSLTPWVGGTAQNIPVTVAVSLEIP